MQALQKKGVLTVNLALYIPGLATGKGGAEKVAANLAMAMRERGHRISLIYQVPYGAEYRQPQYTVPFDARLVPHDDSLAGFRKVRASIRDIQPDLILLFYANWQLIQYQDVLQGLNIPVCYQECSNPSRVIGENWALSTNAAHMRADLLTHAAGIRFTQPAYIDSLPPDLRKIARAFPNAFARVEPLSRTHAPKTILHVGGRKKNKNLGAMLDAFALLRPVFPDWKLMLCGIGTKRGVPANDKILDRIEREFAPGSIEVIGTCENMAEIYTRTGIHCITSLSEGLPNCVCEAMCRGVPSVGFKESKGTNLLIRDGIDGLLAENSAEGLAAALARLMNNEELSLHLGVNAWEAASQFAPEKIYDHWEQFFEDAARRKNRQRPPAPALAAIFTDWTYATEPTWYAHIKNRLKKLSGKVLFFGAGSAYRHFHGLCSHLHPQFMLLDDADSRPDLDGIAVCTPAQIDERFKSLPVIIFSKEAAIIAHRLHTQYGFTGEMLCVDKRLTRNQYLPGAPRPVPRPAVEARRQQIARNQPTYSAYDELLPGVVNSEQPACAFCGSRNEAEYMVSSHIPWYGGEEFRLVRCQKCNLVYNSPRPPESYTIDSVNRNGEYLYHRKLNRENVQGIHDRLAADLLTLDPGIRKAFDVAFGAGTLLKAFRKLGVEASGNEINHFACQQLSAEGFTVYNVPTLKLAPKAEFDLITMLDYLEHTYTPFDDLLKAWDMLRPGGGLYLKTLFLGSPSHLTKGAAWQLFGQGHFCYFLPKTLVGMVENAGFEILKIEQRDLIHITAKKPEV